MREWLIEEGAERTCGFRTSVVVLLPAGSPFKYSEVRCDPSQSVKARTQAQSFTGINPYEN